MSNLNTYLLRITLIIFLILLQVKSYSATCVSLTSGNWNEETTWVDGVIPDCGDSIVILASHTVTIANQQDYSACATPLKISIFGTMQFVNGNKLKLPCNSTITIFAGGKIVPDNGGGNSNYIEICNVVVWRSADGTYDITGCMGCSFLLPIELIQFELENMENKIAINWSTTSEKNTDYFLVERSGDGMNWKKIVKEKAAENSATIVYYEKSDEAPLSGVSYYRLKIVDRDSAFTYSEIRSVERIKKEPHVMLFPNPSKGIVTIEYESYTVSYEIYDVNGKKMKPHINENLQNKISLDFSNLQKGMYFINIYTSENNQYVYNKVMIE